MSKKGNKKPNLQVESKNENQYMNEDESEIPYRRSLIIQQFNDFKLKIQNQEEQIKEGKNEIKNLEEQLANEAKIRNDLNSKLFNYERRNNDLESINIFQKNEITKKDKKINLLNQEIINLKSRRVPSNDFPDQEAKDMIDHLSKELDEKDNEIIKLNTKIKYLLKENNLKDKKIDINDELQHSNDSSENNENQLTLNTNKQILKQGKILNVGQVINKATSLPSKSSASNVQFNSKNEDLESKNKIKQIKKIKVKKNKNDKQKDNEYEINIDVVAEPKPTTESREPHYKSKSPPHLDISSISASQKLITTTPITKENHVENNEYEEEEELPNTSRSVQNKNKTIKGRRNTNIVGNSDKRSVERDFKSDDDIIKPAPLRNKRITRKKKIIKQKSVTSKESDNKNILNNKNQAENNSASNNDMNYSESSQSNRNNKKLIKKVTKKYKKKSVSPILTDSDVSEKSKTQPVNKSKPNSKNSNDQKKNNFNETNEPLPNINFDESEDDNDEGYQSSDDQLKLNNQHPAKPKKVTKKIVRKRIITNEAKNEINKAISNNKESDENKNDINNINNKRKNKKKKVIKRKVTQITTNEKAKAPKNILDDNNDSSSNTLDSNGISASKKILAVKSMKKNINNANNDNQKDIPQQSLETQNAAKSRAKVKARSKAKTINVSKQQQNLLNTNKDNQVLLKPQQSQPQVNNNQVKPQNYGDGATIASRATWLNNQLFGTENTNNNKNENVEELLENVVTTNKAIVRNPRRGVNRRPPTILNDM